MSESGLRRDIGPLGSSLLAFNGIVGAGIFALPATLHLQFGAFSPWLFPIFGLLILLIALPFAQLAAQFARSGGPVAYTACFGPAASFQVGWLYYLARLTAYAANATVFAAYAGALWPPLATTAGRAAVIVALVGFVTWINIVGVRRAVRALDLLSALKILPLVLLAGWALSVSGAVPAPDALPSFGALEAAALITLYAFVGFENCVVPASETRAPQRTIPRAILFTIAATAALYFVIQLAYVSHMPTGTEPDAPLASLAELLLGPLGLIVLSLTAMASVGGNLLASITSTPRVTFALGKDGLLPAWFGQVHSRWSTPANSILFMGLAGAALALTGSFVWLAIVSTLARLFVYAACIAGLPSARRAHGRSVAAFTWLAIGGGILICAWAAFQSEARSWLMLGALLLVGLALYAIAARGSRSSAEQV